MHIGLMQRLYSPYNRFVKDCRSLQLQFQLGVHVYPEQYTVTTLGTYIPGGLMVEHRW